MRQMQMIATVLMLPAAIWVVACGDGQLGRTPTDPALDARNAKASFSHDDDGGDDDGRLRAIPAVFVAREGECGELTPGVPYPAGSNIVTSAWLGGMGLPDDGGPNFGPVPADNPSKRDPHDGLLLNKNGNSFECSSAQARITGVRGMRAGPELVLGFDYRNGTHCGGGAPRFNVTVREPNAEESRSFFVGNCALGVRTEAPQDPLQWTRVRFATALPPGTRIERITIVYDEGTENPGTEDPNGVGLSVIDNIFINGQEIRRGEGIAEPRGNRGRDRD